jgi:hypothetical protein
MAKLTPRETMIRREGGGFIAPQGRTRRWITRHGMTTTADTGLWRKLKSEIAVTRTGGAGDKAFEACVTVGGGKWRGWDAKKRASGFRTSCEFGRNPRAALARTFAKVARNMKSRAGSFARYK